jgi:PAS domain S-box-containing protein
VKIDEATFTANNLKNLINSTDIATIFLDRSLRVVMFTPAARNIFNLIPADYGRPLTDITSKLDHQNLQEGAEIVLEKLTTTEQEVATFGNNIYLMRISPYRTAEDRINGVVISFIDITARKEAEQLLQENMDELTRFNQAMVSRETRMIEMKKEVNELCRRLGEPLYIHLILRTGKRKLVEAFSRGKTRMCDYSLIIKELLY